MLLAATGVGAAWQAHSHASGTGKPLVVTGQVLDVACFVGHNSSGQKHARCAES
jgi:hypothetical protein